VDAVTGNSLTDFQVGIFPCVFPGNFCRGQKSCLWAQCAGKCYAKVSKYFGLCKLFVKKFSVKIAESLSSPLSFGQDVGSFLSVWRSIPFPRPLRSLSSRFLPHPLSAVFPHGEYAFSAYSWLFGKILFSR